MMNKELVSNLISNIATNYIGTLQSVNGSLATVVIGGQVYPDLRTLKVFDCDEFECVCPEHGKVLFKPFDWGNHIGSDVLVTTIDKDHTRGVVVGVLN